MANFIKGGLKGAENQQIDQEESWPQYGLRQAAILGKNVSTGLEYPKAIGDILRSGISSGVEKATGIKDILPNKYELEFQGQKYPVQAIPGPELGSVGESIDEALSPYYTKEQLMPHGVGEKFTNRVARGVLPTAFMSVIGGAPFLGSLGRGAFSALAGQAAEEAGVGPLGQASAELVAGIPYDFIRKGGNPVSLFKWAKEDAKKDYAKAAPFQSKIITKTTELEQGLQKGLEEATDAYKGADKTRVIDILKNIEKDIFRDEIPLNKLIKQHRRLGKIIYGSNPTDLEKEILTPVYHSILDNLKTTAKQNPEWGEPWFRAQGLSSGTKTVEALRDFFIHNPAIKKVVPNKTAQMILSTGLLGGGLATGAYFGTKSLGKKPSSGAILGASLFPMAIQAFKSPAVVAHLKELGQAALVGDKAAIINAARGYNSAVEDLDAKPHVNFLKGGFK